VPSRDDIADDGVAGGGGDELEEGPERYLNLGLVLLLFPDGLLVEEPGGGAEASTGVVGGVAELLFTLLLAAVAPPGLLSPNLSLKRATEEAVELFDAVGCGVAVAAAAAVALLLDFC
jgi:hypothetical protein